MGPFCSRHTTFVVDADASTSVPSAVARVLLASFEGTFSLGALEKAYLESEIFFGKASYLRKSWRWRMLLGLFFYGQQHRVPCFYSNLLV